MYGSIHRSIDLYIYLYLSVYLPIHPSIHPASHPSIHPPFLSTAHRPKVVRMWCVLNILTSKWAFHHCYDVFRATGTRVFSTSQLPKMAGDPQYCNTFAPQIVRTWCVSDILTSKSASPQQHEFFGHCSCQKWSERAWCVLNILTSKCASHHNCGHFLNISSSKSGPNMRCFHHFYFDMCYSPQRRTLFEHLNFQGRSKNEAFLAFWLSSLLRATRECHFLFLIWPDDSAPPF